MPEQTKSSLARMPCDGPLYASALSDLKVGQSEEASCTTGDNNEPEEVRRHSQ